MKGSEMRLSPFFIFIFAVKFSREDTSFHRLQDTRIDGTAWYAGLLLAPAESFDLWPSRILPSGPKKRRAFYAFFAYFRHFLCPLITSVRVATKDIKFTPFLPQNVKFKLPLLPPFGMF